MLTLLITAALAGRVSGELEQEARTTSREKVAFATQALVEVREARDLTAELHANAEVPEARQCLESKLARLDHLASASEVALMRIPDAIAAGDDGRAEAEFRKVTVALTRARQTRDEAYACAALPATSDASEWGAVQVVAPAPGTDEGS